MPVARTVALARPPQAHGRAKKQSLYQNAPQAQTPEKNAARVNIAQRISTLYTIHSTLLRYYAFPTV